MDWKNRITTAKVENKQKQKKQIENVSGLSKLCQVEPFTTVMRVCVCACVRVCVCACVRVGLCVVCVCVWREEILFLKLYETAIKIVR